MSVGMTDGDGADALWRKVAEGAGLAVALRDHADDVAAAAASAAKASGGLSRVAQPVAEPWPPMRVGRVP